MMKKFLKPAILFLGGIVGVIKIVSLHLKDKEVFYVCLPNGIGEIINIGVYLPEVKKRVKKEIVLIYPKNREAVIDFIDYDNYRTVGVGKYMCKCIQALIFTRFGRALQSTMKKYYLNPMRGPKQMNMKKGFIWNLKDEMKLTDSDMPLRPRMSQLQHYTEYENTVFLNPYARTIEQVQFSFYEKLVEQFKNKGFSVVTILGFEELEPIQGTTGIVCNLKEAMGMIANSKGVVGVRSGFMDLAAGIKDVAIVCVYPQKCDRRDFFSFSHLEYDNDVAEIEVCKQDSVDEVIQFFCGK